MAKYIIEREIHIGDLVTFIGGDGLRRVGEVQDISQLPDVFIEGFENLKYTRWRIGIERIEELRRSDINQGDFISHRVEIEKGEAIERVRGGDVGTPEFNELIYTYFK